MSIKLGQHGLGNILDMDMWLMLMTWIMAWPNDARRWFIGPERTLRTFKMAEPVLQIGDMMTNALIILPPVCFCLCLECQEKGINILLAKRLQRLGVRVLLGEKGEKIKQDFTIILITLAHLLPYLRRI